jgi:hypothetical protein
LVGSVVPRSGRRLSVGDQKLADAESAGYATDVVSRATVSLISN